MVKRLFLIAGAWVALAAAAEAGPGSARSDASATTDALRMERVRMAQANQSLYGRRRQRYVAPLTSNATRMNANRAATIRRQMFPQRGGAGVQQQRGAGVVIRRQAPAYYPPSRMYLNQQQIDRRQRIQRQLQRERLEYQRWLQTMTPEQRRRSMWMWGRPSQRDLNRMFQGPDRSGYGTGPARGKVIANPTRRRAR